MLALLLLALFGGCSSEYGGAEGKARLTVDTMLSGLREANGEKVCDSLTPAAASAVAEHEVIGESPSAPAGCARVVTDAASQRKSIMRDLGDVEITDVDLASHGATVETTADPWFLEEIDGDYLVTDASLITDAVVESGLMERAMP